MLLIHTTDDLTKTIDSGINQLEHLINIYNRKRIVVFYNTCEKTKESSNIAKKYFKENVKIYYIDGNTSQKERSEILDGFETKDDYVHIIFNVNILSEGVSLPCIDSILLMDAKTSHIMLMQIIGRALRVYKEKEESIICIPSSCLDTVNVLLQYFFLDLEKTENVKSISEEIHSRILINNDSNQISMITKQVKLYEMSRTKNHTSWFQEWIDQGILYGNSTIPKTITNLLIQLNELTEDEVMFLNSLKRKRKQNPYDDLKKFEIRVKILKFYLRENYSTHDEKIQIELNEIMKLIPSCEQCGQKIKSYDTCKQFLFEKSVHCSNICLRKQMSNCLLKRIECL
jgi:superfamily II DNA/RNA helicase